MYPDQITRKGSKSVCDGFEAAQEGYLPQGHGTGDRESQHVRTAERMADPELEADCEEY